jgi:Flp pilus assembly protein TadD
MGTAMATLEEALGAAPAHPELLRIRGTLLLRQGDLAGARGALEKARSVDASEPRLHVELSNVYRNLGELTRARDEAREALRLDPESPDAQVAHGLVLGALGQEPDAGRAFREALRLAPDHPDALFYLGSVELRAGHAKEALALLESLVEKAPDYPHARDTLAVARELALPPPAGSVRLRLLRTPSRAKAEALARRLADGEPFAALAISESVDASAPRGGDLGTLRIADLVEPLRSAAAALAPGQVSPVIETADGYVLLERRE